MISETYHIDCVRYMVTIPDNFFDIAIVDPPYGIGENWKKDQFSKFHKHQSTYKNNSIPGRDYFNELFRISKNQIIWGGNYYTEHLRPRHSWITWNKFRDYKKQHMAEGELAWTSFNVPLRIVNLLWCGCSTCEPRYGVHPHEKPIRLYVWLLNNYATPGDKIFDSHLGSGSSRIAAHKLGFDFYGCEIDKDYFEAQEKRFEEKCLGKINIEEQAIIQNKLF